MSEPLETIEARRVARKKALQEQADAQRVIDITALDEAEQAHGDTSVCRVDVPYTPGLPTCAIAKIPRPVALKRYRDTLKVKDGSVDLSAANAASEQLVADCLVYPDAETFAKMCEARPNLRGQLGAAAAKLANGKAADEGKDFQS